VSNDAIEIRLRELIALTQCGGDAFDAQPVVLQHGGGFCPCALDDGNAGSVQRVAGL
jgi:hypothetical protein